MNEPYPVAQDLYVLPSSQTAPGHGVLPVNAFLVRDAAPVLVDTGLAADQDELLSSLWSLVQPGDLRWVFLTHEDRDHAGNLLDVLEAAPDARLVTNYVTVGKLLEAWEVPLDRVVVVNPGERFSTSARELHVLRPPVYDASGTVGLFDPGAGALLSVDAFGTYLPEQAEDLAGLPPDDVRAGLVDFNRYNHPWVSQADHAAFARSLDGLRRLGPTVVLSSHGLPARGEEAARLFDAMAELPALEPYTPPDQAAFEELRPEMG